MNILTFNPISMSKKKFLIHLNQLGSLPGVHFILQPKEGI